VASSKSQRYEAYAHNAARSAQTRGGPVRGAVVGANAGAGAAIGPAWARRAGWRRGPARTATYYDRCIGALTEAAVESAVRDEGAVVRAAPVEGERFPIRENSS
jgi:hypothetical protein